MPEYGDGAVTFVERVMATLDGRRPDRMAIFDSYWPEFQARWAREKGLRRGASIEDYYGIDIQICVSDETPYPSRKRIIWQGGRETISRDGYGRLVRPVSGCAFCDYVEHPIRSPEDLARNPFESAHDPRRYTAFLSGVERNRSTRCCFCKVGGPYLRTSFIRGEAEFLTDIASDVGFARALADRMADFLIDTGLQALERSNLWGTGIWIFDDMAYNRGPMFSPRAFEQVFLSAYERMVRTFKSAGAYKVIVHSDRNILPLLDMMIEAGIDGINPVEPKAGMDVVALKNDYGGRRALIGGMCNARVLPTGGPSEVRDETRRILEAGADGGVVIGNHSIWADVGVSNYECYYKTVRREGRFH